MGALSVLCITIPTVFRGVPGLEQALNIYLLKKQILGRSHCHPVRRMDRDQLGTSHDSFGENLGQGWPDIEHWQWRWRKGDTMYKHMHACTHTDMCAQAYIF